MNEMAMFQRPFSGRRWGSDLHPHLAPLNAASLGLEPEQGFLAVLAPLLHIGLKRGAVCDTFKDVARFQGHSFQGHLEAWLRALQPFSVDHFRHVLNLLLYSHLATLDTTSLGLEPEQGFLAVFAPLLHISLKRGAVCETFDDVTRFHRHRFHGHLEARLRTIETCGVDNFCHVIYLL
jgi:hypothetical protein